MHIAQEHNLDPFDKNNLQDKAVHNHIVRHLRTVLHDFPGYAKNSQGDINTGTLDGRGWTADTYLKSQTAKNTGAI